MNEARVLGRKMKRRVVNHMHTGVRINIRHNLAFAFSSDLMFDFEPFLKTDLKIITRDFCASNHSF